MQDDLLPLFPLGVVLFPRTPLGLHIFEPRYKQMVGEAVRAGTEFGIVLAGRNGMVDVGCTAVVERVPRRYPDGRFDIIAAGRRRFGIRALNEDLPCLRCSAQFFDDDQPPAPIPPSLCASVLAHFERLRRLEEGSPDEPGPLLDDPQLSFQLAQFISDLGFRQELLAMRSELARMERLDAYLPAFLSRQTEVEQRKQVAPTNGHSKWPDSLKT
jgi:Lon protease-like protein